MAIVTVSLSSEEKALLDQLADAQSLSDQELAGETLRQFLRFEADQLGRIQTGIAAADRGDFVTDDEVDAFFSEHADPE